MGGSGGMVGDGSCQGSDQSAANAQCAADELCQPHASGCVPAITEGSCQARPTECSDEYEPVCGCDGEVHDNLCAAQMAGVAANDDEQCSPPAGTFRCGSTFCDLASEYCERAFEGPRHCKALPPACSAPGADCACMEEVQCDFGFPICSGTPAHGFVLEC